MPATVSFVEANLPLNGPSPTLPTITGLLADTIARTYERIGDAEDDQNKKVKKLKSFEYTCGLVVKESGPSTPQERIVLEGLFHG